MSDKLTTAIIEHVFSNLGILEPRQISILSKEYLTNLRLQFEDGESVIWACETIVNNTKLRIMCAHQEIDEIETIAVIKLDGCPTYGCYYSNSLDEKYSMLAFTLKDNVWVKATMYIQATFLAGMETMRDLTVSYKKCKNTEDLFKDLKNFIKYYENMQE